jgi:hypothetical protein
MASKYKYPQSALRWRSDGVNVELFTMTNESENGMFGAIDESLTDGLLLVCEATPEFIDVTALDLGEQVPEMADSLYPALLDYIRYRLLGEQSGEDSFRRARVSKKDWEDKIYQKRGGKIQDAQVHVIVPDRDGSVL